MTRALLIVASLVVVIAGLNGGGLVVGPILVVVGSIGFVGVMLSPRLRGILSGLSLPAAGVGFALGVAIMVAVALAERDDALWVDTVETTARVTRVHGMDDFEYEYQTDGRTCAGRASLSGVRSIFGNSPETERVGDTVTIYYPRARPCLSVRNKPRYDPYAVEHGAVAAAVLTPILASFFALLFGAIGRGVSEGGPRRRERGRA